MSWCLLTGGNSYRRESWPGLCSIRARTKWGHCRALNASQNVNISKVRSFFRLRGHGQLSESSHGCLMEYFQTMTPYARRHTGNIHIHNSLLSRRNEFADFSSCCQACLRNAAGWGDRSVGTSSGNCPPVAHMHKKVVLTPVNAGCFEVWWRSDGNELKEILTRTLCARKKRINSQSGAAFFARESYTWNICSGTCWHVLVQGSMCSLPKPEMCRHKVLVEGSNGLLLFRNYSKHILFLHEILTADILSLFECINKT